MTFFFGSGYNAMILSIMGSEAPGLIRNPLICRAPYLSHDHLITKLSQSRYSEAWKRNDVILLYGDDSNMLFYFYSDSFAVNLGFAYPMGTNY